jgi:hypothetical protein
VYAFSWALRATCSWRTGAQSGFLAWFLWWTVYPRKMPGWSWRLEIAVAWTLDLILGSR